MLLENLPFPVNLTYWESSIGYYYYSGTRHISTLVTGLPDDSRQNR